MYMNVNRSGDSVIKQVKIQRVGHIALTLWKKIIIQEIDTDNWHILQK